MSKFFPRKGWRRTAIINVVLAFTCDLALLIFLVVSISQPEASLARPSIIFYGSCTMSSGINLSLHLLINVISTAVLASSNFFMQILNAPSRQEIDRAHTWLRSLDIGIPSIKNLSHISRLKAVSWLIFFITSLPIHILFNSVVFETTYERSQWQLTLASEKFTLGAPFFPPGASLFPAGMLGLYPTNCGSYGEPVVVDQYRNPSSDIRQKIESVAEQSHTWTLLNATECQLEYVSCKPKSKYSDVVVILDSTASTAGWARSDVFTFDPSTDLSTRWNTLVPPNATNSLWFSAQCTTTREKSSSGIDDYCSNTCLGAMGLDIKRFLARETLPIAHEPWLISFFPAVRYHNQSFFDQGLDFNDRFDSLRVKHCLAQPTQPFCKVGLSNALLLAVILSISIKVMQGSVIVWKLQSASIVTPGDAIESFISHPDPVTRNLGTLDIMDSLHIEFGMRKHLVDILDLGIKAEAQPRRWKSVLRHLRCIIPYSTWVKTYSVLFGGLGLLSAGFAASSQSSRGNFSESLDHSNGVLSVNLWANDRAPGYVASLLLANTPQLILSLCYFSYNYLLTQFHVEKEWNSFCLSYQPLRVSYPVGQQVSTYRLQLPYRHSVPLIIISITLHWLVSNAVFLYVNEGGYWDLSEGITRFSFYEAYAVPNGSLIQIGFSPPFFLVLFILSILFIIFPPVLLGFFKVKGDMPAGGWNSLVISAACHVPNVENNHDEAQSVAETNHEIRDDTPADSPAVFIAPEEDEASHKRLLDLTRRKLRWGAMALPRRLAEYSTHDGQAVQHVGFGGEEHDVSEPKDGQYYM